MLKLIFKLPILMSLFLFCSCSGIFYYPSEELEINPSHFGLKYQDIWIHSENLKLHGWFLPAVSIANHSPCLLFFHGNAANISNHQGSVAWLPERGINVFLIDYRGFGKSAGYPSPEGLREDAHAALEYVVKNEQCKHSEIFILGQSLGGSISIELLATSEHQAQVSGLIIDSAFSSYRGILREKLAQFWLTWPFQYPLSFLVSDDQSPENYIEKLPAIPKLFLHGKEDQIVPVHHSQTLFDLAPSPKEFISSEAVGHIASFRLPHIRLKTVNFLGR